MSAPEPRDHSGGTCSGQRTSAAARAHPAESVSASARGGADAARHGATALRSGGKELPSSSAVAPGSADAAVAGLAAMSMKSPGGDGVEGGEGLVLGMAASVVASPPFASPDAPAELLGDDGEALTAKVAASPFSPPASVPLFGDDSIIVVHLRAGQARSLYNQSAEEAKRGPAGEAEEESLERRAWVVLLAQALPVLQRRIDKGTLLPGMLRRVEEAYLMYKQQLVCRVTEQPVPGAEELRPGAAYFGYYSALDAALTALSLLPRLAWRADQRGRVEAFVLAALRLIPKTAGITAEAPSEEAMVDFIEHSMTPKDFGADFCAAVLSVWRSPAVANVLRGVPQRATAALAANKAEFEARQKADVAKRGLWRCALPSCGRQETTVLQFRVCGHCRRTRYCCPEHGKLHWRVHKREGDGEASGGGAAA